MKFVFGKCKTFTVWCDILYKVKWIITNYTDQFVIGVLKKIRSCTCMNCQISWWRVKGFKLVSKFSLFVSRIHWKAFYTATTATYYVAISSARWPLEIFDIALFAVVLKGHVCWKSTHDGWRWWTQASAWQGGCWFQSIRLCIEAVCRICIQCWRNWNTHWMWTQYRDERNGWLVSITLMLWKVLQFYDSALKLLKQLCYNWHQLTSLEYEFKKPAKLQVYDQYINVFCLHFSKYLLLLCFIFMPIVVMSS